MLDKLNKEMIIALKAKDNFRLQIIRMLISEIKNEDKVKGKKRTHEEVISSYLKKIKKSLDQFPESYRDSINKEIKIIEEFSPKLMEKVDIVEFIKDEIIGSVTMQKVMPLLKGKADGKIVREVIDQWNKR